MEKNRSFADIAHRVLVRHSDLLVVMAVPVSSRKTQNGISGSAIGGKGLLIILREMRIDQAERSKIRYRLTIRNATFMSMTSNGGICEKDATSNSE
jgi:hypothetical protein